MTFAMSSDFLCDFCVRCYLTWMGDNTVGKNLVLSQKFLVESWASGGSI